MPEKGIVYAASGKKYIEEARKSAASVKDQMPDTEICLMTNGIKKRHKEFDNFIQTKFKGKKIKQKIYHCPYEKVIFLDTDTYVSSNLCDIFELLERFDLAANQISSGYHYEIKGLPDSFPEFNSGLIAFNNNKNVKMFMKEWGRLFERMDTKWDQKSFRYALYKSDLRVASLPIEYNFMIYFPAYAMAEVKVLHGRPHEKLLEVEKDMNEKLGHRVFIPRVGCVHRFDEMTGSEMIKLIVYSVVMVIYEVYDRYLSI